MSESEPFSRLQIAELLGEVAEMVALGQRDAALLGLAAVVNILLGDDAEQERNWLVVENYLTEYQAHQ